MHNLKINKVSQNTKIKGNDWDSLGLSVTTLNYGACTTLLTLCNVLVYFLLRNYVSFEKLIKLEIQLIYEIGGGCMSYQCVQFTFSQPVLHWLIDHHSHHWASHFLGSSIPIFTQIPPTSTKIWNLKWKIGIIRTFKLSPIRTAAQIWIAFLFSNFATTPLLLVFLNFTTLSTSLY